MERVLALAGEDEAATGMNPMGQAIEDGRPGQSNVLISLAALGGIGQMA